MKKVVISLFSAMVLFLMSCGPDNTAKQPNNNVKKSEVPAKEEVTPEPDAQDPGVEPQPEPLPGPDPVPTPVPGPDPVPAPVPDPIPAPVPGPDPIPAPGPNPDPVPPAVDSGLTPINPPVDPGMMPMPMPTPDPAV
jgi:hypothetical protein